MKRKIVACAVAAVAVVSLNLDRDEPADTDTALASTITTGPAVSRMAVFRRPSTSDMPAALYDQLAEMVHQGRPLDLPANQNPGRLKSRDSARMLVTSADGDLTVYGVPTDKGAVCRIDTNGWGGCTLTFMSRYDVSWGATQRAREDQFATIVLIPDDVRAVRSKGNSVRAGTNAFLVEPTDPAVRSASSLVVEKTDGRTHTIDT